MAEKQRYTTESFIEKAKEIHGDKYDYSKVEYVNYYTKVCIICPKHGEFWQTPKSHFRGYGCKKCSIAKSASTTKDFVRKAKEIHGGKYDYSKVEYINAHTKVCIICHIHGEFWQKPSDHLNGSTCPRCTNNCKYTTEEFISKAKEIHGDKYDYSKVDYINNKTKVFIICPIHGEFWQNPSVHLIGHGCPQCSHRSYRYNNEEWILKAKEIHGDKYDYSKVNYINNNTKVCIICPIHGEFWQTPINHLNSGGCYKCGKKSMSNTKTKTTEQFIIESKQIFGENTYDYSKVEYKNSKIEVCLICPKHGEFYVKPNNHLTSHAGCQQCAAEKNVNETILFNKIKDRYKNIKFIHSKRKIKNLKLLEIDIYDEKNKIAIEYQGDQHFMPNDFFGGMKSFKKQLENDKLKQKICEENGIKLYHFTYNKNYVKDNIDYKVYTDENELFEILDNIYKNNASN